MARSDQGARNRGDCAGASCECGELGTAVMQHTSPRRPARDVEWRFRREERDKHMTRQPTGVLEYSIRVIGRRPQRPHPYAAVRRMEPSFSMTNLDHGPRGAVFSRINPHLGQPSITSAWQEGGAASGMANDLQNPAGTLQWTFHRWVCRDRQLWKGLRRPLRQETNPFFVVQEPHAQFFG